MRFAKHPAILVATSLAATAIGSPAFAATSPKTHPTSLNARASKAAVAPNHRDPVLLTLRSGKSGVAGEATNFLVRTRRDGSKSSKWGAWAHVAAIPGSKNGQYKVQVTMPASAKKGQKEDYQVKFSGDPVKQLAPSRSQVFIVKAS